MTEPTKKLKLAILASGGPAPGINSVIAAATIEAINMGWDVYGVKDGYLGLVQNDLQPLTLADVSWIHFQGGAVLGMSRTNPKKPENLVKIVETLQSQKVDMLLTIGGDDTAFGAAVIADEMKGKLRTVHVPKTIDNDLPLPEGVPTFGFMTARHHGVQLVKNIMVDAQTNARWYIIVTMGRQAGHLALGIGKASGATISLIPEEFDGRTTSIDELSRILEGSVIKGIAAGRDWGVAVLAEGLIESFDPKEFEQFPDARYDNFGHLILGDIEIGKILAEEVEKRVKARGHSLAFRAMSIGYEFRCADPVPFDIEYTRDLGYAAIKFLAGGGSNAMVLIDRGRANSIPFDAMRDPETGKTLVRNVDIHHDGYLVARRYMQRLTPNDFDDDTDLVKYATAANCSPEEFVAYFGDLVKNDPAAYAFEDRVRDALVSDHV